MESDNYHTDSISDSFWEPWQYEIPLETFEDLENWINLVYDNWSNKNPVFAWRGQVDSSWPLHSSLYRRLMWTRLGKGNSIPPVEEDLYNAETNVLANVHKWGLHANYSSRLSVLYQLAMLQHYGAPTRLIDITFNPFIGAWFSVQANMENNKDNYSKSNGRIFAIDIKNYLINEMDEKRDWEDTTHRPWPDNKYMKNRAIYTDDEYDNLKNKYNEWRTTVYAWKPPHLDNRISSQNGGFIFGGVPLAGPSYSPRWKKKPGGKTHNIETVRRATSVPLRLLSIKSSKTANKNAVYTAVIKYSAKNTIRNALKNLFGYDYKTIYPDYTGFSMFGNPELYNAKPKLLSAHDYFRGCATR